MRSKLWALLFPVLILFWGTGALADESGLYREANRALVSRDKVLLAAGATRLVVWKDRALPDQVGIIVLSDLRRYPEEVFFTLPGFAVNTKGIASRPQQCSWWRIIDRRSIIYACGIAMKQNGRREMVTQDMVADLTTLLKNMKPLPVTGQGDFIELVYLIKPSTKTPS